MQELVEDPAASSEMYYINGTEYHAIFAIKNTLNLRVHLLLEPSFTLHTFIGMVVKVLIVSIATLKMPVRELFIMKDIAALLPPALRP